MNHKVVIGCPIRNRAWILPEYLSALESIDYDNKHFLFLENDSDDGTKDLLIDFSNRLVNAVTFLHDFKVYGHVPNESRDEYGHEGYGHLAKLRNKFLELFLMTDCDYLLSVDSDVIVPPDILTQLLKHSNQDTIIGAAISNIPGQPLDGHTPGNFMVNHNGLPMHPNPYPLHGLMSVDVIGAVYLIPRKVLESGVRYDSHSQGEDIPFCVKAAEKCFQMRVMMDVKCEHRMIKP